MKIYKIKHNIILLVTFTIVDILGTSYLLYWREFFWAAVEKRQLNGFLILIGIFTVVALVLCISNGLQTYIANRLALNWRRKITTRAIKQNHSHIEGFAQRIQQDAYDYPQLKIQLWRTYTYSAIMAVVAINLIVHSAGWLYVLLPVLYAIINTVLGRSIAKPLINLNYLNQVVEAKFRQHLTSQNYGFAHRNSYKLLKKTKHLNYFQSFYSQLGVIFPYLCLTSAYFSAKITFSVLMQVASTISHLVTLLGVFIDNFTIINKYKSCKKRLQEMKLI